MSKQSIKKKNVSIEKSEDPNKLLNFVPRPNLSSALVVDAFGKQTYGNLDLKLLIVDLATQCRTVHGGNLARVESMLISQAHALDAIFTKLAIRAANADYMTELEVNLRLGLKAQAQCRGTLETLAAIKNPPIFAKQANIAHGAQQVNNEVGTTPRVEHIGIRPNELLEHDHDKGLDLNAAQTPSHRNQPDKAVVAVDGSKKRTRQGKR